MSEDWKFGHSGARVTPGYLKSLGIDSTADVMAKVDAAMAALEELAKRIDKLAPVVAEVSMVSRLRPEGNR
jgi:hypothetical protein